jgi:hypothetical protein
VGGLQNRVFPELVAEHFLDEADHGAQGVGHTIVLQRQQTTF